MGTNWNSEVSKSLAKSKYLFHTIPCINKIRTNVAVPFNLHVWSYKKSVITMVIEATTNMKLARFFTLKQESDSWLAHQQNICDTS
jgi:hypothetical protein